MVNVIPHVNSMPNEIGVYIKNTLFKSSPDGFKSETLPNGLTIITQHMVNPEHEKPIVSLRLAVKVGMAAETDEEAGIAHLLEHCVFLGTKNMNQKAIAELLSSYGCFSGADANASTGKLITSYKIDDIPSADISNLDRAVDLLYELAVNAIFPEDLLIKERRVVETELVQRSGMQRSSSHHLIRHVAPDANYTKRMSAALSTQIKQSDGKELSQRVLKFYQKWYQPQNMVIVVVGNLSDEKSRDVLLNELKIKFGQIPPPKEVGIEENIFLEAPLEESTVSRFSIFEHETCAVPGIVLMERKVDDISSTVDGQCSNFIFSIYSKVIATLISDLNKDELLADKDKALQVLTLDFDVKLTGTARFIRAILSCSKIEKISNAWHEYLLLMKRLLSYEPSSRKICFIAENLIQQYERRIKIINTAQYHTLADEYIQSHFEGSGIYHLKVSHYSAIQVLRHIKDGHHTDLIRVMKSVCGIFDAKRRDKMFICVFLKSVSAAPEIEKKMTEVYNSSKKIERNELKPFAEEEALENLMTIIPQPVEPIAEKIFSETDCRLLSFANGYEVYLKKTDSESSRLTIDGLFPIGHLQLSPQERENLAVAFYAAMKFPFTAGIKSHALQNYLNKYTMQPMKWAMDYNNLSISMGLNDLQHFERAAQVVHLDLLGRSDADTEAFLQSIDIGVESYRNGVERFYKSPSFVYNSALYDILYSGHSYFKALSFEERFNIDKDKVTSTYEKLLKNVPPGKLVVVGNFDYNEVRAHVCRYIGTLPRLENKEFSHRWEDFSFNSAINPVEKVVYTGTEANRTKTKLIYYTHLEAKGKLRYFDNVTVTILNKLLNEEIRKKNQALYSISFSRSNQSMDFDASYLSVDFVSLTEQQSDINASVKNYIDRLRIEMPNNLSEILDTYRENTQKQYSIYKQTNEFWRQGLLSDLHGDFEPFQFIEHQGWLAELTPEICYERMNSLLSRQKQPSMLIEHPKDQADVLSKKVVPT